MRFISRYGRFGVQIQREIVEYYASGQQQVTQPGVYATFEPYQLEPHERALAIEVFGSFPGSYQELDEATPVPPDYRIGLFDTDAHGYDPATKAMVEEVLLERCVEGGILLVVPEAPGQAPPWPAYDSFKGTPSALVKKVVDDGYDPSDVLAYEEANQNRPDMVEALRGVVGAELEEVIG
jgi:hypothetical protein